MNAMCEKINCLVIDDEPLALAQLATYVSRVPFLNLVGRCCDSLQALDAVRRGGVDLIFADISMPDMSGLELARQVGSQCLVVFTTAHPSFAIDGYKVNAVDYLLKPFGLADVVAAAEKARLRFEERRALESARAPASAELGEDDYIFVKTDARMARVRVGDILLVEGMSEYVRIYARGEAKPLTTLLTMKRVEAALPPSVFLRVHRSWIVNMARIESFSRLRISIAGKLVPVSDNYKERFLAYIDSRALR